MKKSERVFTVYMQVTPKIAAEWLESNIGCNRHLSVPVIDKYVGIMERGEWNERNGETIKFDSANRMIDGQHRLSALIKAGKTFWFLVARNCSEDAFKAIDAGKVRGTSDTLATEGFPNTSVLAGALTLLHRYKMNALASTCVVTNAQISAAQADNPDMETSAAFAVAHKGPKGFLGPSIVAFIHYMGTKTSSRETADKFVLGLVLGEPCVSDSAIRVLRQRLIGNMASKSRLRRSDVTATCIKAFNAFVVGKPANSSTIRYRANGPAAEAFPAF